MKIKLVLLTISVVGATLGAIFIRNAKKDEPATISYVKSTAKTEQDFDTRCASVVDGDTIKLTSGVVVRMLGVDTPETKHPTKPDEYFGKRASDFTKHLLQGKQVYLLYDEKYEKDRFGRLLAYVHLWPQKTDVNKKIIAEGYGRVSTYNCSRTKEYLEAEKNAKLNRVGMWANEKILNESKIDTDGKIYVEGYYRKDGTFVRPHWRSK